MRPFRGFLQQRLAPMHVLVDEKLQRCRCSHTLQCVLHVPAMQVHCWFGACQACISSAPHNLALHYPASSPLSSSPLLLLLPALLLQAAGSTTPATAVLYFGCRKPDEDYLYEQDWEALADAGALQTLRVAFSRAQASKVYVQHLIKEDSRSIAKLIAGGAHVYVCGDGAAMAKDVHATLLTLLRDEMGLSEAQAAEELSAMAKAGRYVRDIWS
jgi:hypothetical protein